MLAFRIMFPAKQVLKSRSIKVLSNKKLSQETVYNSLIPQELNQVILGAPGHENEVKRAIARGLNHLVNIVNSEIIELEEWKSVNNVIGDMLWPEDQNGQKMISYPLWISYKRNISRSTRSTSWWRLSNFLQVFGNEYKPLKKICQRGLKDIYTKCNYGWGKGASVRMRCSWRFQMLNKPRKQHRGGVHAQTAFEIQEEAIKMIN